MALGDRLGGKVRSAVRRARRDGPLDIVFVLFNADGMGGTARSGIEQANALLALGEGHRVRILSVWRSGDATHYPLADGLEVTYLVDVRRERATAVAGRHPDELAERESVIVPRSWDALYNGLTDATMREALGSIDADVLVTTTPELLAVVAQLAPADVALVHQEHRASSARVNDLGALLEFAPRADIVVSLTESMSRWLAGRLGGAAPELLVIPNPLPGTPQARSPLDQKTFVTAGRLAPEKQFEHLVDAFWRIHEEIPGWTLTIWGDGPRADNLAAQVRKLGLEDRVLLPGSTAGPRRRVGEGQRGRARLARRGLPARAAGGDVGGRATGVVRLPLRPARDDHPRRRRPARAARVEGRDGRGDAADRHRRRPARAPRRRRADPLRALGRPAARPAVGRHVPPRGRAPRRPAGAPPGAARPATGAAGRPSRDLVRGRHHPRRGAYDDPAGAHLRRCDDRGRLVRDAGARPRPAPGGRRAVVAPRRLPRRPRRGVRPRLAVGPRPGRARLARAARHGRGDDRRAVAHPHRLALPRAVADARRARRRARRGRRGRRAVLGGVARGRPARARPQPVRRPRPGRHPAHDDRRRGRRRADARGDGPADRRRRPLRRRRRLHLGRRRRRGVAGRPRPADRRDRRHARASAPAARSATRAATSSATRCAASTSSPRGCAGSTSSPPARCRRGSTRRTTASGSSTTATSSRPRRCRPSARTPSRPGCTPSPTWPTTSSTSTTTSSSAGRDARSTSSPPAGSTPPSSPTTAPSACPAPTTGPT